MSKLAKLQLAGPLVLALTIVAAELATYWLALYPSSEFAWYLNLNCFGIFQRSHYIFSNYVGTPYFQLVFVATPLLILIYLGFALRQRLPFAIASNLSLAYVILLVKASNRIESSAEMSASLVATAHDLMFSFSASNFTFGPQTFVLTALIIPTLLSFSASHLVYIRVLRETGMIEAFAVRRVEKSATRQQSIAR
jgi:hypothetical protein